MLDHELFVATLSGFTRTLLRPYDVDAVLHDLTERVTAVLGLAGAGVALLEEGSFVHVTAFPEHIAAFERPLRPEDEGCMRRHWQGDPTAIADLAAHADEWGAYYEVAKQAGIAAVVGIPLHLDDTPIGVLNLYSNQVREWSDKDLRAARALADMATGYLVNASHLRQHQQLSEQLQHALNSRVVIEQAKGMIATSAGISVDEAFNRIRQHARHHNTALREVARAIVDDGLRP